MFYGLVLGIHLLICVFLVIVVLLQAGKGGGLAGAFGVAGGAAQSLFGGRGAATFLSKATTWLGILFMLTSLSLALMAGQSNQPRSVLQGVQEEPGTMPPPATSEPLEIPGGTPAEPGPRSPVIPGNQAPETQAPPAPPSEAPSNQSPSGP